MWAQTGGHGGTGDISMARPWWSVALEPESARRAPVVWAEHTPARPLPASATAVEAARPVPPAPRFDEAELALACAAAADQARAAALADETQLLAQRGAAAAEAVAAACRELAAQRAAALKSRCQMSIELARTVVTALAGPLAARFPLAELEHCLAEHLGHHSPPPKLTVTVATELAAAARAYLAGPAPEAADRISLEVTGDPSLARGEVRVAWADGWSELLLPALARDLERLATTALAQDPEPTLMPASFTLIPCEEPR